MNGQIHIPQNAYLNNLIRVIWQVDGIPEYHHETIIPRGIVEIIFDLSDGLPVNASLDNKEYQLSRCFINGFNTAPIGLQFPYKQFFFGIQFQPAAVKNLFGVPAREFANLPVEMAQLCPSFHSLWYCLAEKNSFVERVAVIIQWLEERLFNTDPREKMFNHFLNNPCFEAMNVSDLARMLCYSPRHLSRKIYDLTKMNTEEVLLYKRYQHAVHLIHSTRLSLTEIAYNSRFTDQSHFIRTFKSFAKITPGEYRQKKSTVPGHIYDNVR